LINLFNRESESGYVVQEDYSSLLHAKRILCWFEIISGLKVNFYKSSLIRINLDDDYTSGLANVIFCRNDTFPVIYLRFPFDVNLNRLSTWKLVLSTIKAKLSTWKEKFFNMAGKLCLIKSVLSSLSLYYMFFFPMPKGINNVISSVNHFLVWKGTLNSCGICKVA
jgi:hypothetical protein